MKTTGFVVAGILCAFALVFPKVAPAADTYSGNWTLMPSEQPGKVQFGLVSRRKHNQSQHSSDWPVDAFLGLDLYTRGKRDVQFAVTRDAGRFDCEGYLNNGVGAGVFLFTADTNYTKTMGSLGFTGIDEEKQFTMANVDVTAEFARQMKAEKLHGLDTEKLIALKIFDVTPQFIEEMRSAGLPMTDSDQVVAFRVHDVTPKFVANIEALGFKNADPDQLVAMRIHGVTPEYISKLKARGVKDLSIDQLVSLRVHGID